MIILPEQHTLIITPPHTASGHLSKLFPNLVYGPNPDGNIDHHYAGIHNDYLNWRKILIVRRPFERLVGLYQHARISMGLEDKYWEDFCYNSFSGANNWFFSWTITRIMRYYIPNFDSVRQDFEIWPMEKFPELPKGINGKIEPGWSSYNYSKYSRNLVDIWGREDLMFYQ